MASTLLELKLKTILVVTCDGRTIVGQLMGHDQVQNLILASAVERIHASSQEEEAEEVPLGLYVIRGDNVALCGEAKEDNERWKTVLADPLPPIQQQIR